MLYREAFIDLSKIKKGLSLVTVLDIIWRVISKLLTTVVLSFTLRIVIVTTLAGPGVAKALAVAVNANAMVALPAIRGASVSKQTCYSKRCREV